MVRKSDMRQRALDPRLRGLERRRRAGVWAPGPGPDRQGDVGRARPDGRHARAEDRATPRPGANCAWVPSPTAATLHATHYHRVDVAARQARAGGGPRRAAGRASTTCLRSRSPPVTAGRRRRSRARSTTTRRASSATSCAGSTRASAAPRCPTSTTSALMEDRATCRISSQHIANWLLHGVVDRADEVARAVRADGARSSTPRTPTIRPTSRWRPRSTAPRSAPPATSSSPAWSSRRATPNRSSTPAASSGRAPEPAGVTRPSPSPQSLTWPDLFPGQAGRPYARLVSSEAARQRSAGTIE